MTDPCHDAEKAALAEALESLLAAVITTVDSLLDSNTLPADALRPATGKARTLLADLSPAAKEILEKAQAHDAMEAENERLQDGYRHIVAVLGPRPPKECGCCDGCQFEMGEALRTAHDALAGKEPA